MSWRSSLVRILLVTSVLTVVIDLFFQPSILTDPVLTFGVTFLIQLSALVVAAAVTKGRKSQVVVRTLIIALVFSLFVTYVLAPVNNLGFAWNFVAILTIEVSGFAAAEAMVRAG